MTIQVKALFKMGPVLSASSLHGGKKDIFVLHFVGEQTSKIIVSVECLVTLPYRSSSELFIYTTSKQSKVFPWQHLQPDIAEKLTSSPIPRNTCCQVLPKN